MLTATVDVRISQTFITAGADAVLKKPAMGPAMAGEIDRLVIQPLEAEAREGAAAGAGGLKDEA